MRADFPVLTDQRLHTLDIGGIELCQIAILQHRLNDRMLISDFFQNIGTRAVTALSFFTCRQFQSFKEHITELIRGLDIETTARVRVYFFLQLVSLCLQLLPDFIQKCAVCANSFRFHSGQHFDQRQLCLTKNPLQVFFPHFCFLRGTQLRGNLRGDNPVFKILRIGCTEHIQLTVFAKILLRTFYRKVQLLKRQTL